MNKAMIDSLKKKLKSLALANAILSPEWEYRYFSYNSKWAEQEEMASMRDGSGGHWFVLFQTGGRVGYKFISPDDGLIDNLSDIKAKIPKQYKEFIEEPAFYVDQATGIWLLENKKWIKYGLPRAKYIEDLATVIEWGSEDYQNWAEDYYEQNIDQEALSNIFEHRINQALIEKLNPDITIEDMSEDLKEIGINS
jgi:hypothetical protein